MSERNQPVPFEPNAIRHAIGDLAANGAGYVRLGALKLMASMLGMTRDIKPSLISSQIDPRLSAALEQVDILLDQVLRRDSQAQPAPDDADPQAEAEDGDERDEQQEDADDDDEPP